jgi:recombination protein RecR
MAERLVLYLFKQEKITLEDFGETLANLKKNLSYCEKCFNISEGKLCSICAQDSRDQNKICVVEEPLDIIALERTKKYTGIYHVLGGTLGSTKNIEANQLTLTQLQKRVEEEKIGEIILAMNPTTEGDATALYIARLLKDSGANVTKLARGLSTGGDIEYADELTLGSAILNRK